MPHRDMTFRLLPFPNYREKSRKDSGLRKKRKKKEEKAQKVDVYPSRM